MSSSTFFVSQAAARNLKQLAARKMGSVLSSHMSEAIAAALGFNTHAALRAALAGSSTLEVQKPSNERLIRRLAQFGYEVPADLRLLPDLDQSVVLNRAFPIQEQRSTRWMAWRNLMVAAINAGLEKRLFGLTPGDDWWPRAPAYGSEHRYEFTLLDVRAIAKVNAISGDELAFNVLLNPTTRADEANHWGDFRDGDTIGKCWLERRLGAWIQDSGPEFMCRRNRLAALATLNLPAAGYSDCGRFIL